jgi:hypothetical protein
VSGYGSKIGSGLRTSKTLGTDLKRLSYCTPSGLTLHIVAQVFDIAKSEDEVPWTEFRDKYWLPEVYPSIRKNGELTSLPVGEKMKVVSRAHACAIFKSSRVAQ